MPRWDKEVFLLRLLRRLAVAVGSIAALVLASGAHFRAGGL